MELGEIFVEYVCNVCFYVTTRRVYDGNADTIFRGSDHKHISGSLALVTSPRHLVYVSHRDK